MNRALSILAVAMVMPPTLAAQQKPHTTLTQEKTMTVNKMTPNLYTDDVAACVRFWVDRLHFEKTMEVPDGAGLAFAAVQKGPIEVMYGSYASLDKASGASRSYDKGTSFLFVEVDDVNAVFAAMNGAPLVAPIHKTFYGSTEFTVKDPGGHWITFAQFGQPGE